MAAAPDRLCPCGSQSGYGDCCEVIHLRGAGFGTTAEQLMRARYSAYVLGLAEFLAESWHPDTRPAQVGVQPDIEWLGLTVEATDRGTGLDDQGTVRFRARFRQGRGKVQELVELSSFVRLDGRWVYTDGSVAT